MNFALISKHGITGNEFWGGINTHAKLLAALLIKQGHSVTFFTAGSSHDEDESLNGDVKVIRIPCTQEGKNLEWTYNLRNIFLKFHKTISFDCIFVEGASAWRLHREFRRLKSPVFAFVHNFGIVHFYNIWKEVDDVRSLLYYCLRTVPTIFLRMIAFDIPFLQQSRWVISGSEFNACLLERFYRIPRSKLTVVNNWVQPDLFKPVDYLRKKTRAKLRISDDQLVFLLVGSLWRPKGFQIAIKSFIEFIKIHPNSQLLIVGGGKYESHLRLLVAQNDHAGGKVKFLGVLPNSKLPSIFNAANIFIMPSLLSEVLPYVLLEAMSCGLPVIATDLGGNVEAVRDAGILIPPGNIRCLLQAMIFLAENSRKMEYFSSCARKRIIDNFSEEVAHRKISTLLKETFDSGKLFTTYG